MAKSQLKTSFTVQYVHKEIYTGGPLALDDELYCLFCPAASVVNVLDLQTGRVLQTLSQESGDAVRVTAVACCEKEHTVAVSYTSGQLGIWRLTTPLTEHVQKEETPTLTTTTTTTTRQWTLDSFFRVGLGSVSVQMTPTVQWLEWNSEGTLIACAMQREVLVYDARGKWLTHWLRLSSKLLPLTTSTTTTTPTTASSVMSSRTSLSTPQGPVQICRFHPSRPLLYAADQLGAVWVWDLTARVKDSKMRPLAVLSHHLSVVTDITFLTTAGSPHSHKYDVVLASRDKTVSVWDTETHTLKTTLMTFESLEGVVAVTSSSSSPHHRLFLITAGERSILRCWTLSQRDHPFLEQPPPTVTTFSLDYLFFLPRHQKILSVTSDQNIQVHDVETLRVERTIVGFNDEIIDMALLDSDRKLVVVTNSEQVRLYNLSDMSCTLLTAHRDLVLCVDVTRDGSYIATGCKDAEIRVWSCGVNDVWRCVAVCLGHTDAVTSLAFAHRCPTSLPLLISASRDRTIKGWDLSLLSTSSSSVVISLPALFTYKAHDQEINSIALAPTDCLLATGSQDKTIKLWRPLQDCDVRSLSLSAVREWRECATLVGHRRGVWCVAFSPTDQLLASASGDHLIKIWSFNLIANSYRCIKTLEGHTSTVLKVVWTRDGLQCVSAGADGVVILWNVFTEEAVNRFDAHTDKVWSVLFTRTEDQLITAGSDSQLIFWRNVSEEEREAQRHAREQRTLAEQQLHNSILTRDWTRAVNLALHLHHSHQLLTVFDTLLSTEAQQATVILNSLVTSLTPQQLLQLLTWVRDWNTNAKYSLVAQYVLHAIFKTYHPSTLLSLSPFKELLKGLLPYTERHYHRVDRLLQQSFIIDFLLAQLQLTADSTVQNDQSVITTVNGPVAININFTTDRSLTDGHSHVTHSIHTRREQKRKRNSQSSSRPGLSVSDLIRKRAKHIKSEQTSSTMSTLESMKKTNNINDEIPNNVKTVDNTSNNTNENVALDNSPHIDSVRRTNSFTSKVFHEENNTPSYSFKKRRFSRKKFKSK